MQSRNFRIQKVGNIGWLEKNYKFQSIASSLDELIVLNATKTKKSVAEFALTISDLVNNVFIPIAAGGGIKTLEDAEILFHNGADKIVLNSVLVENPEFVKKLVRQYGSQSIIASIDYKKVNGICEVYINNGTFKIQMPVKEYLEYLDMLEVGEFYLNSIEKDGTGFGYDFETIKSIEKNIKRPLRENVSAVATANLFNFIGDGLPRARIRLINEKVNLANWTKYN